MGIFPTPVGAGVLMGNSADNHLAFVFRFWLRGLFLLNEGVEIREKAVGVEVGSSW